MISVREAEQAIEQSSATVGEERVPLEHALGRTLAAPHPALCSLPSFAQSAMDGFAVRSADLAEGTVDAPITLDVIGEIPAGANVELDVGSGETCRIMTGAAIPKGADAVIMQEEVRVNNPTPGSDESNRNLRAQAHFDNATVVGKNIRQRGEDIQEGMPLLEQGRILGVNELTALAAVGYATVEIRKRLRVGVVVTGSELVTPGSNQGDATVFDCNSTLTSQFLRTPDVELISCARCADDFDALQRAVRALLDQVDILIVVGGVSVGKYDFGRRVFDACGVKQMFWRVAQKPGKPLYYGLRGSQQIFGLPGNPVSAWLCLWRYVRPAFHLRSGALSSWPTPLHATLSSAVTKRSKLTVFYRGTLSQPCGPGTTLQFHPDQKQGSHQIASLVNTTAIAELPQGDSDVARGTVVRAYSVPMLLGSAPMARCSPRASSIS